MVPLPSQETWAKVIDVMERIGIVHEQRPEEQRLAGVVPSGFLNMNGAQVEIQVVATGSATAEVKIRAYGQEGLIKQRTAPKAVDRLITELAMPAQS